MKGRIKSNLSNRDIEQRLDEIKYIDRKLREWCRLYEKYPDKTWDAGVNKMKYTQIPKRTRNAVEARLKKTVEKYGFEEVRMVANHYFNRVKDKERLEEEIKSREKELEELKKQK